jgi:hypothetical protein
MKGKKMAKIWSCSRCKKPTDYINCMVVGFQLLCYKTVHASLCRKCSEEYERIQIAFFKAKRIETAFSGLKRIKKG